MLAVVPERRRDGRSSFTQLVTYTICRDELKMDETLSPDKPTVRRSRSKEAIFNDLVEYATRNSLPDADNIIATFPDGRQQARFDKVVCETNCFSLATAATEMNMVASQNTRCMDPVYHAILSWPADERPDHNQIFDAARYCLKRLGMEGHQYVFAIHDDTDNLHVHLSVNRINPVSYKAASLYDDYSKLDRCCRELELKFQWKHDNGPWVVDSFGHIVRQRQEFKPAPTPARRLEHFADRESLHTYAVDKCQTKLEALFRGGQKYTWYDIHDVFHAAGLELREKGKGLAIYDLNADQQTPLRASRLHPELTLERQKFPCGEYYAAPQRHEVPGCLVVGHVDMQSRYDSLLHRRDRGARAERRNARARAREELKERYRAYKTGFVRPTLDSEMLRNRFRALAAEYRIRKNNVRLLQRDPLMRKLMYRALEVEKMKAMAALRLEIKTEREALRQAPGSRCLTYRSWVELQATQFDAAAVSQLRGWAYREKRNNRTAPVSNNLFFHGVADDVRPVQIRGYGTSVNRDGAVVYTSGKKPVLIDRGVVTEVAEAPEEKGKHLHMAMHIADMKSGERFEIRGDRTFVGTTMRAVQDFNQHSGKTIQLTNSEQLRMAGYSSANTPGRRVDEEMRGDVPVQTLREQYLPK